MIIGIYGSGGLGREVSDLVQGTSELVREFDCFTFIDDYKKYEYISGLKVYTYKEFTSVYYKEFTRIIIAVGEPELRRILRERVIVSGYSLQTLVHPSSFIGTGSTLGSGTIVQFGSWISCNTKIGDNVLIQQFVGIGHDCIVGNDAVISGHAATGGNCIIGERAYIGLSVSVKEKTIIGNNSIIGMGSCVMKDIQDNVIALGNPARVIKNNEDSRIFK